MKKLLLSLALVGSVYGVDYASMSTDELMSLRGTVPAQEREVFKSEVQNRVSSMSDDEKSAYGVGVPRKSGAQDGTGSGSQKKSMSKGSNAGSSGGMGGANRQKGKNR